MLLSNIEIASPLFPYDVLEVWDEASEKFDMCVSKLAGNLQIDVYLTSNNIFKEFSIASNDVTNRLYAINIVKKRITELSEKGVHNFTVASPYKKENTTCYQLRNSLVEICKFALENKAIISFEAFDTGKDKCRLVGNTEQVLDLLKFMKAEGCNNFFLTWDLGHFALEEGDYYNSLKLLMPYIKRVHLSNYSTDKSKWYYGDKHLPFNEMGQITQEDIARVINFITNSKHSIESIAFEVAPHRELSICETPIMTYKYLNSLLSFIK